MYLPEGRNQINSVQVLLTSIFLHVIPVTLLEEKHVFYISRCNSNMDDWWRGLTANVEFFISEMEHHIQDNMRNRISVKLVRFKWEKIHQCRLDITHIGNKEQRRQQAMPGTCWWKTLTLFRLLLLSCFLLVFFSSVRVLLSSQG